MQAYKYFRLNLKIKNYKANLKFQKYDLIAGKFIATSLRDEFIDFSLPHYDNGGTTLLMKRSMPVYSLLLFVEVFSYEVWICVISIIAFTALLVYVFERIRVKLTKEKIQFNFSESIWITIGSFTLAGGT